MYAMYQRLLAIVVVTALLVVAGIVPSWAGLKMEEIRAHFENETGKIWDEAAAEEKANFIKEFYAPTQPIVVQTPTEQPEEQEKLVKGRRGENLIEPKLLFFRRGFKKNTGKDWSQATDEEQRDYLKVYREQRSQEASAARQKAEAEWTRQQEQQRRKAEKAAQKRDQQMAAVEEGRMKKQVFAEKRRAHREELRSVKEKIKDQRRDEVTNP